MPKGNAILTAINAERKSLAKKLKALDRAAKHVGGEATKRVVRRKKKVAAEVPAKTRGKGAKGRASKPSTATDPEAEARAAKRARLMGKDKDKGKE